MSGDELRQAVAQVISAGVRDARYADDVARAVLAVPAIADAVRDAETLAKVRKVVAEAHTHTAFLSNHAAACAYERILNALAPTLQDGDT